MPKINDGGAALPEAIAIGPAGDVYPGMSGMTLRDWFAGQAATGIAVQPSIPGAFESENYYERAAEYCYRFADAMIAERSKS